MLDTVFFYLFALLIVGGAILTITRKNPVHSAIFLIVSLIGVAGLYLLQHAEFLFAVQIILYVGGIMVLFLFVIMLVNLDVAAKQRHFSGQWWIALACVAAVGSLMLYVIRKGSAQFHLAKAPIEAAVKEGNTERLAGALFSEYLLPFEIASVLLLVAIVGSVLMAKKRI